jgi:UDP-N-acetyl-D-mannosaminuronic acid dehydrogenase
VLPGKIFEELIYNTRIVGGITRKCAQLAANFYKIVVKGECHTTNARTAELVKLTENAFRDVNIAFANELSMICDKDKINIWELIRLANLHPRVNILSPGPGVGGHCIAVDPWFIVHGNPKEAQLIKKAREVNDHKPHYILKKIEEKAKTLKSPVIACLGLTYKKDVDDIRESPALDIVENLSQKRLGKILVVEPYLNKIPDHLHNLSLKLSDFDQAIEAANIVVLLVDHSAFQYIDRETLNGKFVIDTRGMWS